MTIPTSTPSKLLSTAEVAEMIGIQKNTLEIWRHNGRKGPKFIKYDPSKKRSPVRYRLSDVHAWLDACTYENTSAYPTTNKQ